MWVVPKEGEYQRIITRVHCKWRENGFCPDHLTLPKSLDRLKPYRITFLWNNTEAEERKVILDYNWEAKWVEEKWVGYSVFMVKYDSERRVETTTVKK